MTNQNPSPNPHDSPAPIPKSTGASETPSLPHDPSPLPPSPVASEAQLQRGDMLFGIERSVMYHQAREEHFRFMHLACTFMALASGSAAVLTFMDGAPKWLPALVAAGVCLALLVDQVWDFRGRAVTHGMLKHDFADLLAKGRTSEKVTTAKLDACRIALEAKEPDDMKIVGILQHNYLAISKGYGPDATYTVPWYLKVTGHFTNLGYGRLDLSPRH